MGWMYSKKNQNLQQILYRHGWPIVQVFYPSVSLLLFLLIFKMALCIFRSRDNYVLCFVPQRQLLNDHFLYVPHKTSLQNNVFVV